MKQHLRNALKNITKFFRTTSHCIFFPSRLYENAADYMSPLKFLIISSFLYSSLTFVFLRGIVIPVEYPPLLGDVVRIVDGVPGLSDFLAAIPLLVPATFLFWFAKLQHVEKPFAAYLRILCFVYSSIGLLLLAVTDILRYRFWNNPDMDWLFPYLLFGVPAVLSVVLLKNLQAVSSLTWGRSIVTLVLALPFYGITTVLSEILPKTQREIIISNYDMLPNYKTGDLVFVNEILTMPFIGNAEIFPRRGDIVLLGIGSQDLSEVEDFRIPVLIEANEPQWIRRFQSYIQGRFARIIARPSDTVRLVQGKLFVSNAATTIDIGGPTNLLVSGITVSAYSGRERSFGNEDIEYQILTGSDVIETDWTVNLGEKEYLAITDFRCGKSVPFAYRITDQDIVGIVGFEIASQRERERVALSIILSAVGGMRGINCLD